MKKIILASSSKARRKLLEQIGLKFQVAQANLQERQGASRNCRQLVMDNALAKAQDAAKRFKNAVIIGADTVVLVGNKVVGKPQNMQDALKTLRLLSRKPQWVYTGIAVIDTDTKKFICDYEKTKVYMSPLTAVQIKKYFRKVSPMDKAGSFDIQGIGSIFIARIEGCFYNVVGLPLAKLAKILRSFGVDVFKLLLFLFTVSLAGCATEYNVATQSEEWIYYDTSKEVKIGQSVARQIEKVYKLSENYTWQTKVKEIGEKIAQECGRKELTYHFNVIEAKREEDKKNIDEEVNAVSLPGGYIYVFKGLFVKAEPTDDELACVLAHEVGHVVAKHSLKKLQGIMGYNLVRLIASQIPDTPGLTTGLDAAFYELMLGYSREDELLADRLGARYAKLAGYDPHGMLSFLEKMRQIERKKPLRPYSYGRTHPFTPDRVRVVKQEIGESVGFVDYINLDTNEHSK